MGRRLGACAAVGLWLGLASLAQALVTSPAWAGWGDESWGELIWGGGSSPIPAQSTEGLGVLAIALVMIGFILARRWRRGAH